MEGYPYIQKVASTFTPLQESTSNGDNSTTTNESFEQPVYEQLMPSTLVAAGPYPHDANITAAYNSIIASNMVPETTSSTGMCRTDSYSNSVSGNTCSVQTMTSKQTPPNHAPAVQNEEEIDHPRNEAVMPSICNGNALSKVDAHKSIPLNTEGQAMIPPDDKTEMSMQEASVNEPSKYREMVHSVNTNDESAISSETSAKEDKLQYVSNKSESDSTDQANPSKKKDITSTDEKLIDSIHDEDEENSSDTVISDSNPEAADSGHVSSLFRNVILVQAETITAEENDSDERTPSEAGMDSESESETVDPIEDIGREDENEMLDPAGLLIDETEDNYEILEGVAVGQMGRTVALDAPIIDPNEVTQEDNDDDEENQHKKIDTNGRSNENTSLVGKKRSKHNDSESPSSDEEYLADGSTEPTSQKCQMRKRGVFRTGNVEKQQAKSKQKRSKVSNDDPFGSCASSSSEDVPNDMYFGTPDRVFTVSTKFHWQRQKQKGNKYHARAKGTVVQKYDDDGSSDDEEDDEHARRRAKKAEEIARLKLPAYQQQQLQQLVLKKHPKRDRFYDRSQDIPNDIYFGNVKVPLHILHASSSSSSEEEPWPGGSVQSVSRTSSYPKKSYHSEQRTRKESVANTKSSNYPHYRSSSSRTESTSSQGGTRSVHRMKEYLKMAGFRHMRYQKLWQGCETNQERAEAILRFLQAQGLQGEPTDEKCRELRKEIQLKKEVEVLDTSVIIGSGEGRVTRQRAKKVSETTTAVEPGENHPPKQPCLQKDEQTVEISVPSEAVEAEAKCEQQLTLQEENGPPEEGVEHTLPVDGLNHSNAPTNV
ncbi:HIRA-interacting protein 3-like [Anopheles maculipalpis]|uniref:HIRA-interacting protein 3-like n=1 Tax=Anopheles maculipalpis TaxID=1496333 RepID=UPI002158CBA7|nr:HIRA-interacting protein 3-like [Anopheles maculipalpis]